MSVLIIGLAFIVFAIICVFVVIYGFWKLHEGGSSVNEEGCCMVILLALCLCFASLGMSGIAFYSYVITKEAKEYVVKDFDVVYNKDYKQDKYEEAMRMVTLQNNMVFYYTDALGRKQECVVNLDSNFNIIRVGDENKIKYYICTNKSQSVTEYSIEITEELAQQLGYDDYSKTTSVSVRGGAE